MNLIESLFPNHCLLCGRQIKHYEMLCQSCLNDLSSSPIAVQEDGGIFTAYFYGRYDSKLRDLILLYKNSHHWRLSKILASFLVKTMNTYPPHAEIITWVPSSLSSLEERGFDTMALIAKATSKSVGIPAKRTLESRSKSSKRGMALKQRHDSVKGSFSAISRVYKNIVLIDDVFTTGSTIRECARTLKDAGAGSITVYCIARA
ncbi:MAG TPA: ComF family protein [Pseudothermotoga sp.]